MVAMFSTPILSVAADAVRDLEGRDALSGLWTIFTKCKGSLQNGRRLENITWRLWHREFKAVEGEGSRSLPADSPLSEKDIGNEKAEYRHLPLSEVMYSFHVHPPPEMECSSDIQHLEGATGLTEYHHVSSCLLSGSSPSKPTIPCPSSRRNINVTPLNVGQIICDLLPTSSPCTSKVDSSTSESYSVDKSSRLSSDNASAQPDRQKLSFVTAVAPFHSDMQATSISLKPSGYVQSNAISYLPTSDVEVVDLMLPVIQLSSSSQTPQRPISLLSSSSIIPQDSSSSNLATSSSVANESTPVLVPKHESNKPQASSYKAAPSPQSLPELTEISHLAQVLPPSHPLLLQSSTANVTSQTPTIGLNILQPQLTDGLPSQPPQLVVVNPTPNPTPHPTPPSTPLITGLSGSNRQQWLSLPRSGGGSSSRRERFYSLEAPVLLPPSTVGVLDHEEDPVLSGEEMVQPIIVHLPSNALTVNGSVSRDVFSLGQSPLPLPMSRQATNHEQEQDASARDSTDRSSISSLTSDLSHVTSGTCVTNSSRTTRGTTLSASSSGVGGGEEKISTLTEIGLDPIQRLGNVALSNQKWLGSLSTIHCSTKLADRGRKERITLEAYNTVGGSNLEKVTANVDDEVIEVEGNSAFTSELKSSISARRVVKRNSSPVPLTSSPAVLPLTPMSPSSSALFSSDPPPYAAAHPPPFSPERSTSSGSSGSKQATVTDITSGNMSRATSSDRNSDRSRSTGGSSSKESRSRSREHSAAPIAGLSGLGTLGGLGMTIAAAYSPPVVIKKQMAVGAGKGRVKVAFGRAVGGKARALVRRNSAGPGVEIGGKAYEEAKLSETVKVEMEGVIQNDGKEASQHKDSDHQFQTEQLLALIKEEQPLVPIAAQPSMREEKSVIKRSQEVNGVGENNLKRPPRFNIGSNSDEGSGAGSKSVGSGSSISVGHSIDQRLRTIMGGDVGQGCKAAHVSVNEKKLDALLFHAQERQQRKDETKDHQPQRLGGQRGLQHHNSQAREPSRSLSKQEIRHLKETERPSEKAKGKVKAVDLPALSASKSSSKNKSKSTPNLGTLDPVLAAKLRDSLAEPLLPKGRPVVVDTESDYETESDDGSWSSEEISDDAGTRKQEQIKRESALKQEQEKETERQRQETLLSQMHQQPQQQSPPQQQQSHNYHDQNHNHHQNPVRPAGVQRTHSSHYPAANYGRTSKAAVQRSRQQQVFALHHAKLEQAAKEAQRQREMIKKIPTESLQDLAKARANSVGLLSQLLNPNPDNFPPSHPYRRGASSGAIRPPSELTLMSAIHLTTSEPGPTAKPVAKPDLHNLVPAPNPRPSKIGGTSESPTIRRHVSTDRGNRRAPSLTSPIRGPPMQLMKGGAGVSSQMQVGSITTKGAPSVAVTSNLIPNNLPTTGSGGYRPKGPPKDQEMEEDSDSEPDIGKIQVSESVAEQKLKTLVAKRGIRQKQAAAQPQAGPSKQPQGDEDVPDWARVSQPDPERQLHTRRTLNGLQFTSISRPVPTAPIPLGHPYNLPLPAPPTTPRTTRRQMLSTELSESLRRNLLWERQVSKINLSAMKRSSSGGGSRRSALTGLQPFTGMPRVVQLHAKGTIPPDQQTDPAQHAGGVLVTDDERNEMRRHAMARNRSWANEYHYSGW